MKYVNAGIKSRGELASRLIAGEVFYTPDGSKAWFCEKAKDFMFNNEQLNNYWNFFTAFNVAVGWKDSISEVSELQFLNKISECIEHAYENEASFLAHFLSGDLVNYTPESLDECYMGGDSTRIVVTDTRGKVWIEVIDSLSFIEWCQDFR